MGMALIEVSGDVVMEHADDLGYGIAFLALAVMYRVYMKTRLRVEELRHGKCGR